MPSGRFTRIWSYFVRPERCAEFEALYGAGGAWAELFAAARGFVSTSLERDRDRPHHYVTLDVWESEDAWRAFRRGMVSDYDALDARGAALTVQEQQLGGFDRVGSEDLSYHLLDVFTDRLFGGNPLAVFPSPPPLDTTAMQRIAAELGLSETVFVYPPAAPPHDCALRIFTPKMELPFAGHPTVGTGVLLAHLSGKSLHDETTTLRLEERAGVVDVTVRRRGAHLFAELRVPVTPELGPPSPRRDELAAMLGLDDPDLAPPPDLPCFASAGVPFLIVPVAGDAALRRARLDVARWQSLVATSWAPHVYVVSHSDARHLRVRMFAPAMGIVEDPATGAAAAALPAYLAHRASLSAGEHAWIINQGSEVGRPSELHLRFVVTPTGLGEVYVGGTAVQVGEGRLRRSQ